MHSANISIRREILLCLCSAGVGNELSAANLVKSLISKVSLRVCAKMYDAVASANVCVC